MMRYALVAGWVLSIGCGGSSSSITPPDTTTVSSLRLVKSIPIPPNFGVHDTYLRDGFAFVCAWNTGLIIYDVGNGSFGGSPSTPVEVSRIVTSDDGVAGGPAVHNAWWFHNPVTGEKRYVFVGQEGPATIPVSSTGDLHVVDVSDLTAPREVAFFHLNHSPSAGAHNAWVDESAQVLYEAFYDGGVVALDVSGTLAGDLSSRVIARIAPAASSWVWGVQLANGSLYAIDLLNGLYQLRLQGQSLNVVSGGGNVPERYSSDLWVTGSYVYTGTWGAIPRNGALGNVVKIWHLDAGGAPSLVDSIVVEGIGTVSDVKGSADGQLLVFSAELGVHAGLYLYRLTDPVHPVRVAQVLDPAGFHTAKIADIGGRRYVFAARNPGSPPAPALMIFDVTAFAATSAR
jgi:hypothetical protein